MKKLRHFLLICAVACGMVVAFLGGAFSADIQAKAKMLLVTNQQWAAVSGGYLLTSRTGSMVFLPSTVR